MKRYRQRLTRSGSATSCPVGDREKHGLRSIPIFSALLTVPIGGEGVDVDPEVMRWPGVPPVFSFRDPDGNTLYLV